MILIVFSIVNANSQESSMTGINQVENWLQWVITKGYDKYLDYSGLENYTSWRKAAIKACLFCLFTSKPFL
jgi:hypothetical protein